MKRARDVRDQLMNLMERVEINLTSSDGDSIAIRKWGLYWTRGARSDKREGIFYPHRNRDFHYFFL